MTIFAFTEYSVEHSSGAEQSDMATMERCKRLAFDVIQLGQKHTARLPIRG
jgi:hypothetical protein